MALYYHKINSQLWLNGSIRVDLEPDERSVWADLLALAGITRESRRGWIERSQGIPYTKDWLLNTLQITEELFDRAVQKCKIEGRLQVYEDGTMYITNWEQYNDTNALKAKVAGKQAQKENKETLKSAVVGLTRQVNELEKKIPYNSGYIDTATGEIKGKGNGHFICGQSLEKAIAIARGEIPANSHARTNIINELEKYNIKWEA